MLTQFFIQFDGIDSNFVWFEIEALLLIVFGGSTESFQTAPNDLKEF